MTKIILAPLPWVLVLLWVVLLWQFVRGWPRGGVFRVLCTASLILLFCLTLLSSLNVSRWLYRAIALDPEEGQNCPLDAVVVLGGGYMSGSTAERDALDGESALRVMKGAQVFRQCGSRWFVTSGRTVWGTRERHADLMRNLAVQLGVPEERILTESESRNTREHPIYLQAKQELGADASIAVVTSPWHLRRVRTEFYRIFPKTIMVTAYDYPSAYTQHFTGWLPQVNALSDSSTMLYEIVGMLWYRLLDRFPSLAGSSSMTCS